MRALILLLTCVPVLCMGQKAQVSRKHRSDTMYEIDVYAAFKQKTVMPLSSIAERIDYIPLEKTSECIIENDIGEVCISSTDVFVFDFHLCYRFDRMGHFLNAVGRTGRGPEELVRPVDMAVDTIHKWVYLSDIDRIVQYDYEGKHIQTYDLTFSSMEMLLYNTETLLLDDMLYSYANPGKRYSLKFFSMQTEKVSARIACEKKDKIPFSIDIPSMYEYGGHTFVKDYWENIIYQVLDPGNLKAYAGIDMGKFKYRDRDDQSPVTGKTSSRDKMVFDINFCAETDRYLFMTGSKGHFLYDKKQDLTRCCEFTRNGDVWYTYVNDLNHGPDPKSSDFPKHRVQNNTLVTYHHAYEFFETNRDESPEIRKLKTRLSPDDNPVLALVKIKQ
jgi:hypothetical protein